MFQVGAVTHPTSHLGRPGLKLPSFRTFQLQSNANDIDAYAVQKLVENFRSPLFRDVRRTAIRPPSHGAHKV
jgi:hypothetical protein